MMFDSFEAYDVQETRRVSREEGEQLYLIKQIIKKIIKNISVSQIATDLLEPLDTIQPIYDLAMKQAPDFNAEKILNQLTSSNTSTLTNKFKYSGCIHMFLQIFLWCIHWGLAP